MKVLLKQLERLLKQPRVKSVWFVKDREKLVAGIIGDIMKNKEYIKIPKNCPICGQPTIQIQNNNSTFLFCGNKNCKGKLINYLDHFCGKKGLDIKGLSLATLENLFDWGCVNSLIDLYYLK